MDNFTPSWIFYSNDLKVSSFELQIIILEITFQNFETKKMLMKLVQKNWGSRLQGFIKVDI